MPKIEWLKTTINICYPTASVGWHLGSGLAGWFQLGIFPEVAVQISASAVVI